MVCGVVGMGTSKVSRVRYLLVVGVFVHEDIPEPTQYMLQYPFRIPNPLRFRVRGESGGCHRESANAVRGVSWWRTFFVIRGTRVTSKILGSSPATCDIKHRHSSCSSPDNDAKVY